MEWLVNYVCISSCLHLIVLTHIPALSATLNYSYTGMQSDYISRLDTSEHALNDAVTFI